MTVKQIEKVSSEVVIKQKYELIPPEGGWGYMVALGLSFFFICTIAPISNLGIVFGSFLASVGDETSGIAMVNGMFNTVLCLTGLAANPLLQKLSFRKVGFFGAVIYFGGAFSTIFVTNIFQFIISYGVIQGLGFGLMLPALFTTFNHYFDKRKNVVMSLAQALIALVTIATPPLCKFLMDTYGFRGTVAILAACGLNCFPAMLTLQPVKWHLKRKALPIVEVDKEIVVLRNKLLEETKKINIENEPFLENNLKVNNLKVNNSLHASKRSLVSVGSMAMSVTNLDKAGKIENTGQLGIWKTLVKSLDLGLFKDPVYVNISLGLSLSITSDLTFIAILPLLLVNAGCNGQQVTIIMMVYFVADLIGRVTLSILSGAADIKNRHLFLFGATFSAVFRIAFLMSNAFWWITTVSVILGFLRAFIQIPLPLVVAETYPHRFVTAFSLYMVVCGFVALACGPITSLVKSITHSDTMVVHVLTIIYLLCVIPWFIEIIYFKIMRKNT